MHPVMPICNVVAAHIDIRARNGMYDSPVCTFIAESNVRMDPDVLEYRWILAVVLQVSLVINHDV